MQAELNACMRNYMHVCGNSWVHVCGFWVHVCGNGWMQSLRLLGACMETLGRMSADFWCKYVVVRSKSMERLGACLTVDSFA